MAACWVSWTLLALAGVVPLIGPCAVGTLHDRPVAALPHGGAPLPAFGTESNLATPAT